MDGIFDVLIIIGIIPFLVIFTVISLGLGAFTLQKLGLEKKDSKGDSIAHNVIRFFVGAIVFIIVYGIYTSIFPSPHPDEFEMPYRR
ncbi:MAG: hypothetical protein WD048_00765 [Chitinophagales bacterium]